VSTSRSSSRGARGGDLRQGVAAGERDGYAGSEATQRVYAKAIEAASKVLADANPSPVDAVVKTIVWR
jgi:hypothetical protein